VFRDLRGHEFEQFLGRLQVRQLHERDRKRVREGLHDEVFLGEAHLEHDGVEALM
jgi:hypothetical protein